MNFVIAPWRLLWQHRRLLRSTTRSELKGRFAGSVFGVLWLLGYPLLLLAAYAGMFLFVFKAQPTGFASSVDYVLLIFCGLIPFLGFSESLGSGTPSIASNASLIKNTLFPIELVPVRAVFVSQAVQVVGSAILLLAITVNGMLTPWVLLLPLVWALPVLFTLGMVWVVSSVNVYVRDLQQIVSVLILFLMMASPIAVSAHELAGPLSTFSYCNPLWYVMACYQDLVVHGRAPTPGAFGGLAALGIGSFLFGHWFFGRMKRVLVDNV